MDKKRLLLIEENQLSQIKEFSTSLCMGRCKCVGSLTHSLYKHLSYLGPVSCVFTSWLSSLAPLGVLQSLMTVTSFDYWHSTAFFSCVLMGFQTHPKLDHCFSPPNQLLAQVTSLPSFTSHPLHFSFPSFMISLMACIQASVFIPLMACIQASGF